MSLANSSLAGLRHENAFLHQREHTLQSQLRELTGGEPAPATLHGARRRLAETDYSFTKERVTPIAVDKKLLLSFVNIVRIDFARTWVHHVRRLGMTNWLVGATDPRAFSTLKEEGVACFDMKTNLPQGEWPWGSPSFKSLGPYKIELVFKALSWGFEVVITDIDVLVLREPFAFMARWPDAGFLTTSDHLSNTTNDQGLETHRAIHSAFNIGYMFFRPSALPLVDEWLKVINEDRVGRWDQGEFGRVARIGWDPSSTAGLSDPRLFWAYHKKVVGGVLSLALFCGGHNYFASQFPQRLGWQPYSIHTTFQYGAADGKRHRLREAMAWEDPPEYYDPPGGLLTYTPDVPYHLLSPDGGMHADGHVRLIEHQLAQVEDH